MNPLGELARWYISRELDTGRPVPDWVRRRLRNDAALRNFAARSRELAGRLSAEANAEPSGPFAPAVCVLPNARTGSLKRTGPWNRTPAVGPGSDRKRVHFGSVVCAIAAGVILIVTYLCQSPAPDAVNRVDPATLSQIMRTLPVSRDLREGTRAAGSVTGRMLAVLGNGVAEEHQDIWSDAKSASMFFTQRLPAGMAHLVGWEWGGS